MIDTTALHVLEYLSGGGNWNVKVSVHDVHKTRD
jgi:hypothetical protein